MIHIPPNPLRHFPPALAVVGAAVLIVACGGSGGGGGGPTQPATGITFSEGGSPDTNTVYMTDSPSGSPTALELEVRANQMDHVLGFAFDIEYPTNLLSFQGATAGDFLGTSNVEFLVSEREPGKIIVGITRIGDNRSVVSGSGLVATFNFVSAGAGSGPVEFENEQAFRQFSSFTAADWLGGTVNVVP